MLRRLFPNVYEGWWIVGASALFGALTAGTVHYGFGTVFEPLRQEFGWGVGATAVAFSVRTEVNGIASPIVGMMVDRVGPKPTLIFGVITVALAVFLMSLIQNLWQFYAVMFLISVGMSSSGGPVGLAAVATWFRRRRARAMALVTVGGGLATLLVPLVSVLVTALGWRAALQVISVVLLVGGVIPILNTRYRPQGHPQPIDGLPQSEDEEERAVEHWGVPVREAVRSRAFIIVALAFAGSGFATTAFVVLQIPFLQSEGVSPTAAAFTVTAFGMASIPARMGFALLADRYPKRFVLAAAMLLVAVGVLALPLVHELWQALPIIMLVAVGFGGAVPVRPALVADYFGTRSFGTIHGLTTFVRTLGATIGPLAVGLSFDITGSYTTGWLFSGALILATIPLILLARPPEDLIQRYRLATGAEAVLEAQTPTVGGSR